MDKKASRQKRSTKTRAVIRRLGALRLSVHRTPRHIYAQVFSADGSQVLVSACTLEAGVKSELTSSSGNVAAAKTVGRVVAERALKAGIKEVSFDRSGFKYHGRIAALADAAREAGLTF